MDPPDKPGPGTPLNERIDELESLIGERGRHAPPVLRETVAREAQAAGASIPVLDQPVTPADYLEAAPAPAPRAARYSEQQLQELIGSVEGRLARELERLLVHVQAILRDKLRAELQTRLTSVEPQDSGSDEPGRVPPGGGTSETN